MKSGMFCTLFLFSVIGVHAQTLSFYQSEIRSDHVENLSGQREFRIGQPGATRGMRKGRSGFNLMVTSNGSMPSNFGLVPLASGPNLPVLGSGTIGRLAKWTGLTSSNSFIGDSTIFESKFGLVGIGTDLPTSKLTVQGMIETTLGGIKFPDGTVQITSAAGALSAVFHNATLTGDGTSASPLGVAVPLGLQGSVASPIISAVNTSPGAALAAFVGAPVASVPAAGLFAHTDGSFPGVIAQAGNGENFGGDGVRASGGDGTSATSQGGAGLIAHGGNGTDRGGVGVLGVGGAGNSGGVGVAGQGATGGADSPGGDALDARGGNSQGVRGGTGLNAMGGDIFAGTGNGGIGVLASGGIGRGQGQRGGTGIVVVRGNAEDGASVPPAGSFTGNVEIFGDLEVNGTKNFRIDHPLDPENKYLVHAAIESSEVLNVYSGNVTTDVNGEAIVNLPAWFDSLNKDLRYQLTVIGTFAQAIIASEVQNNRFIIKTNAPAVKVSWQVTGVRCDADMKANPFTAERVKPHHEQGTYLNPEAYGQSEERNIHWVRYPELMQKIRQTEQRAKPKQNTR